MLDPHPSLSKVAAFFGPANYRDPKAAEALVRQALDALQIPTDFIRPGDRVVLKPNWVKEHDERRPGSGQWEHVVTHPAVIEVAVLAVISAVSTEEPPLLCTRMYFPTSAPGVQLHCPSVQVPR